MFSHLGSSQRQGYTFLGGSEHLQRSPIGSQALPLVDGLLVYLSRAPASLLPQLSFRQTIFFGSSPQLRFFSRPVLHFQGCRHKDSRWTSYELEAHLKNNSATSQASLLAVLHLSRSTTQEGRREGPEPPPTLSLHGPRFPCLSSGPVCRPFTDVMGLFQV